MSSAEPVLQHRTPDVQDLRRRERLIESFESDWRRGQKPQIDGYLPAEDGDRRAVLVELVHADMELRLQAGEPARVEDYLTRYPELADDSRELLDLIAAEYDLRREREPDLRPIAYQERFGQHVSGVLAYLKSNVTMKDAKTTAPMEPWPTLAETVISGFKIVGEVGSGAMGVVYRAWDLKLNRFVALKLILDNDRVSAEQMRRFLAEGQAMARLHHPHIVQIYTCGEHEGTPYLAMELVDGPSLAQRLDRRPQSPGAAARLVYLLARAAHVAHQKGIVHRDLKPANVLLAPDSDEPALNSSYGWPKIADFGLARVRAAEETPRCAGTFPGLIMGTAPYMAPEQARGNVEAIGPATDVYALGAILYELLTGRPPFQGATPIDALAMVLSSEPIPPSRLAREVPPDLEAICLKCLEKNPADRPTSAAVLAEDLQQFLNNPGRIRSSVKMLADSDLASQVDRGRSGTRSWMWKGVAALALAMAVAIPMGLHFIDWKQPPPPKDDGTSKPQPPLSIVALRISHYRGEKPLGRLGLAGPFPRFGDDVRVHAKLSDPAHAYLLAFTADGKEELCFPAGETVKPQPASTVAYPPGPAEYFDLTQGEGWQAFVLLASRSPLPPYREWRDGRGQPPWSKAKPGESAWGFDGKNFERLDRKVSADEQPPGAIVDLCSFFSNQPGIETIKAVVFPILPLEKEDKRPPWRKFTRLRTLIQRQ